MKGPRSSFGALPENLSFDHGSTSNDAAIDSNISWNNLQTPQNRLQDYRTSSNEINNTQYLQHVRNDGRISEWSFGETSSSAAHHQVEELPYKPPNNILSLDNANVNTIINHSNGLPQDLNMMSSQFGNQENNGCQIIGSGDGRRISRKRKSLEFHTGQSSGVGNSNSDPNYHNNGERLTENELVANGGSELPNPRLGIGSGESPFSSTTSGDVQSYRRNFRLRVGGFQLRQVDPIPQYPFVTEDRFQNIDVSSSRLVPPNPPHAVENGSFHGQSVLLQASSSSRRNHQSRNIPRNIPEHHPMFVPASEMRNSASVNWSLGGGSSNSNDNSVNGVNGNVGSSSRVGLQYPRRLSEMVRRSLLAGSRHVGQGSNNNAVVRLNSPADAAATSQEMALPLGPETNNGHRVSNSRSALLERHLDGAAFGMPYSLRALAAAGEGRSSIMSEQIRHVLDLMRRGEGLRFEDMMILENSVLFGMADIHDRHRDMRLDVDNMSYEELLALEERIGNVCTGLSEKTIMNRLKQRKYVDRRAQDQVETEPCSICCEEYKEWEDVGTLECGHDFHTDCIRQWLMQKNICPICKTTGLKI